MKALDNAKNQAPGMIADSNWVEVQHIMVPRAISHCEVCAKLEGCWFLKT